MKGFDAPGDDKVLWHDRYRSISNLERHLHANGTRVIKFFLPYLSKEEQRKRFLARIDEPEKTEIQHPTSKHSNGGAQRKRFLARIDEPEKNRKFRTADVEERKFWKHYMKAYEECLSATSTGDSPWYLVPADHRFRRTASLTPFGVTTIGRLMRIGCAIMKSSS